MGSLLSPGENFKNPGSAMSEEQVQVNLSEGPRLASYSTVRSGHGSWVCDHAAPGPAV